MTIPVPKFAIGDVVWNTQIEITTVYLKCPDCNDTSKWKVITAAGEFSCPCYRCQSWHNAANRPIIRERAGTVKALTIGRIMIDTRNDIPVSYMCEETGISGGLVYQEDRLFSTEEEAKLHVESLIATLKDDPQEVKNTEEIIKRASITIDQLPAHDDANKARKLESDLNTVMDEFASNLYNLQEREENKRLTAKEVADLLVEAFDSKYVQFSNEIETIRSYF